MIQIYLKKLIFLIIFLIVNLKSISPSLSVELPKPLEENDILIYKKIFLSQLNGDFESADKLVKLTKSDLLKGRVLAQRYLHPKSYISKFSELKIWLDKYGDHPSASRIYWLSKRKKPKNAKSPKKPKGGYLSGFGSTGLTLLRPPIPATNSGRSAPSVTREIALQVRRNIRRSWPTGALSVLNSSRSLKYLTRKEESQLYWEVANGYLIFNKNLEAITQASKSIRLSDGQKGVAWFTAGLANWRRGDIKRAGYFFTNLADLETTNIEVRSAGAYWGSRVALINKNPSKAVRLLSIAAKDPENFYGQLALSALGQEANLEFGLPNISNEFLGWLDKRDGGKRAFALIQVGEYWHADREFRKLYSKIPEKYHLELMALASIYGMPSLSYRLADLERRKTGKKWLGALYPEFIINKNEKYKDIALLLAIIRNESRFDQRGKSPARAQGLMQILPSTAAFIMKDKRYRQNLRHDLLIPEVSFKIGEKYISHLLKEKIVNNDLVMLLAAYNGGPGNLKKWTTSLDFQNDPLLLIETMKSRETRAYIKAVMSNLFIYRNKLGFKSTEIKLLSSGKWSNYKSLTKIKK